MTPMVSTHKEYHHMARKALHRLALGTILGAALLLHSPATAGAPPVPAKVVTITAVGARADKVLEDLFAQVGLRVKVSALVNAQMNGKWTAPANTFWRMMSSTHNLVAYYDGSITRIYAASEVQSRTVPTASPSDVVREASRLGLLDAHNVVRAGSSNVSVSGVPEFIRRIEDIASRAAPPQVASRPSSLPPALPRTGTTNTSDVISPSIKGPAVGTKPSVAAAPPPFTPVNMDPFGAKSAVRYDVTQRPTVRSPYEIRVFYLKHREAADETVKIDGQNVIYPGVASGLQNLMSDIRRPQVQQESYPGRRRRYDDDDDFDQPQPGRQSEPQIIDMNGPRIAADPLNKSIMVRDRPEAMATYEGLIQSMDIEQPQVEVEATIIELDMSQVKKLGLDLNINTKGLQGLFGGAPAGVSVGSSAGQAGVSIKGKSFEINARLDALVQNGYARVISKPRLTTKHNRYAVFGNQQTQTAIISSERVADVDEQTAGLFLKIKPSVVFDVNSLRTDMSIEIQDGKFLGKSANGSVLKEAANIMTNATIEQGEAIIVGGLTVSSEFEDRSKTAGVGDIPVIGEAFKRKRTTKTRSERLFMITPRIYAAATSPAARAASNNQGPATGVIPLEVIQGQGRKSGGKR
jgi:type III secretion protein C